MNSRQQEAIWSLVSRAKGLLIFLTEKRTAIVLSHEGYYDNDIFFAVKAARLLLQYNLDD